MRGIRPEGRITRWTVTVATVALLCASCGTSSRPSLDPAEVRRQLHDVSGHEPPTPSPGDPTSPSDP